MTDVFISYKKEDAARVEPIARALAKAGYEVWWDHRIPPGSTYRDVIGAALQSAKCVIVVWSSLLDRFRRAILGSSLLQVTGRLQRSPEGIIHVVAERLDDRSATMARIAEAPSAGAKPSPRSPGHPRQERIFPRSRDFH